MFWNFLAFSEICYFSTFWFLSAYYLPGHCLTVEWKSFFNVKIITFLYFDTLIALCFHELYTTSSLYFPEISFKACDRLKLCQRPPMRGWIFLVFKDVLHVVFNYSIVSSRVDSVLTQNYHFELKTEQNLSLETNNLYKPE